jgi:D-alanine-D-alanine ligase
MLNVDVNAFGKVAVLLGGHSAERDISLKSGAAVLESLRRSGVNAHPFDPAEQSLLQLQQQDFQRAFLILHGRGGEDGTIQGALTWLGLPYTGSQVLSSAIAMDKVKCKQIWQSANLPTAPFRVVNRGQSLDKQLIAAIVHELGQDVVVKPAAEGSSVGIFKVNTMTDLHDALVSAFQHDDVVLIERTLKGKEFTVAILDQQPLPPICVEPMNEFYDYHAKYESNSTRYLCPTGLPDTFNKQLESLSKKAYDTIGLQGWGRVDLMQDEQQNMYLLEVNSLPGMTEKSLVPMAAKEFGIDFDELVLRILLQTVAD